MKRRRHQSDTSEVALMAVMTKAMGAFLILMVFAMQYYIPDFTAEQIAAIVNRSIGSVRKDLAGAVDRIKKGDFTKQDLEALQREIEVALAKLSQAESDITRLQTRLDQSVSQLRRVEGERARLEAEAQELKAEIARLRAFDPAKMQAAIERLTGELSDKLAEVEALKINCISFPVPEHSPSTCSIKIVVMKSSRWRSRGKTGEMGSQLP